MDDWGGFFSAQASAASTLLGLIFVAVSINLDRVLENTVLPLRALEGLASLLSVLFVAAVGLIPHQFHRALGTEFAGVGALVWLFQLWALATTHVQSRVHPRYWVRVLCCVVPAPCLMAGGALITIGWMYSGGLWLAAGVLLSYFAAVIVAWVLLVEIKR